MSVKRELHEMVDRIHCEAAAETLAYLRHLLKDDEVADAASLDPLRGCMEPACVSGSAFFSQEHTDLRALAAPQGVGPVTNFDDLLGDFWPQDETADELIAAVRQWRREADCA